MTRKKCLCRCGNPTTHLPKWSSSVPHWGHPEASHAPCCDSEDTATLQKQHPNEFNLDGAARWNGGESRTCDTLQYTNGLHSFQPTELLFSSSSRMGRFGSQLGGTDFLPLWLPLRGLHHLSGSRFLDIHPLPDWKHEPCSQGQIFIYKGFDSSQVNRLWKFSRPFGLQVTLLSLYFSWQKFMQEIQSLLHTFLLC